MDALNSLRIGDIKRRLLNIFLLSGFAFVYMEDERDAEDAIRALDRVEFGKKGRRLRVEWTKVMCPLLLSLFWEAISICFLFFYSIIKCFHS